jgi:hypothetical protein
MGSTRTPTGETEAAKPAVLEASRWNNVFELGGRWLVVNSITMRAAAIDAELAGILASGRAIPSSPGVETLARLGIVATAQDDERRGLDALGRRPWAGPILDLFAIGPVTTLGGSLARHIALVIESITGAHQARAIRTVKLRLCGASRALARRNSEILSAVAAVCHELDIKLVSLLIGDELHDALACSEAVADAYFFRWRPVSADHDGEALEAIRGLLRRGKLVAIQIAARDREALRAQQGWFQELATDDLLMRNPNAAWDVGVDDGDRPFFAASVCHRGADRVRELAAARGLLTDLGLPLRPAVAPFQFHPGCPLLVPGAHIVLPTGRRVACTDDVGTTESGVDPRGASRVRVSEQLARSCTRCSVLPFCLSRCPKLPAPVPDSPECEQVKQGARVELRRLLESGQLRAEHAEQGSGPQ